MKRVKALLTFLPNDIGKPITYVLVKEYDLWVNILSAEIAATKRGRLILDIQGETENIERAMEFLKSQAVEFRILNGSVRWSDDKCVHCGACISVCPSGSLKMGAPDWTLEFNPETCYLCQLCVKACPVGAMRVSI